MFGYGSCTISDVQSNPACYNWGYDPVHYNAPEWRYSQYNTYKTSNGAVLPNPDNLNYVNRIVEVQNMISTLHENGIRAIMDVVYNHTFNKQILGAITMKYYTSEDHSGCGNSLDVSNPMVSRLVQDSLEYWVGEIGFDGFRFDLMGVFPIWTVKNWAEDLNSKFGSRNIMMYGEPWTGANGYPSDGSCQGNISTSELAPG
jgi:pullulanase